MNYLDTSLLVSLVVPELRSRRAAAWLKDQPEPGCISLWARAELAGALGMKVRTRELSSRQAVRSQELFDETVLPFLSEIPIDRSTFTRCFALLGNHRLGLRAPDALHLAICRGPEQATLVTADRALHKAALAVGSTATLLT